MIEFGQNVVNRMRARPNNLVPCLVSCMYYSMGALARTRNPAPQLKRTHKKVGPISASFNTQGYVLGQSKYCVSDVIAKDEN
jgi:hypothetical protein